MAGFLLSIRELVCIADSRLARMCMTSMVLGEIKYYLSVVATTIFSDAIFWVVAVYLGLTEVTWLFP